VPHRCRHYQFDIEKNLRKAGTCRGWQAAGRERSRERQVRCGIRLLVAAGERLVQIPQSAPIVLKPERSRRMNLGRRRLVAISSAANWLWGAWPAGGIAQAFWRLPTSARWLTNSWRWSTGIFDR
jgi:hypothetical protein